MHEFGNRKLLWSLAGAVMSFLYAPIVVMMIFSFNGTNYTTLPWGGFSFMWYEKLMTDQAMLSSVGNSVYVAVGVVLLGTLFGVPAAMALDRYRFPGKEVFRRIVLLPIVLPGVITGVALLSFYVLIGFHLSLYTIMLGQGTGLMCITITEVFARLQQTGKSQEEAAFDLGATQFEVFTKVTLPSIKTAVYGAVLITFSISFDEIAVTYLLTGRQNTLPMQLWSMLRREATPEINAIATLVVLASIVLITIGIRLSRGTSSHPPIREESV